MSYHHLTTFEPGQLEAMYKEGQSIPFMAAQLLRSPSTISHELRRCGDKVYTVENANGLLREFFSQSN